jgi:hypothetical protein
MSLKHLRTATLLTLAGATLSGAAILATLKTNAPGYPNPVRRVYEKPSLHTSKGEVVEIVRWSMPLTQVRNRSGRLAWVESNQLDTINIPAVLSLSKPAAKATKLTAADDSAVAKRWMEAQKNTAPVGPNTEKPLDFPTDSTHITPRNPQDSTQK